MKQKTRNISVLIIAATIALAVFTASAAADTTTEYVVNISVTSPNTYFPAPEPITVPENITELRVSADTTDMQIDIHLYDPSGRHTGATYPTGEETNIPNSTYSGWKTDPEVITVTNPAAGNYTLKAYGFFATGWANCTITIKEEVPGEKAHITGRVVERLPDATLKPLGDVTVTAYYAETMTIANTTTTGADGYFTIDVEPYKVYDLKFTKAGYKDRDEEGIDLTNYGPCETYDMETIFMTQPPSIPPPPPCVNISAVPMSQSVCVDEDAIYILTVCNCGNKSDTVVLNITTGPGTLNKTTFSLDADKCGVAKLTVRSSTAGVFHTTVRATSQRNTTVYEEVTVTTTVIPENLNVLVYDYATGSLVGTFNKTNEGGKLCHVPEVWVEVRDLSGNIIKEKFTDNGSAKFCIDPNRYTKVNVFANSKSLKSDTSLWYMPNVNKPKHYVPWIEPGSESGVAISDNTTTSTIYVGVYTPPVHTLTVDATPKSIVVNTPTDVTVKVTGSYTWDGTTVTEDIPDAYVCLSGAGITPVCNFTNTNGEAFFSGVTPTIDTEDILVTATKPMCFDEGTGTIDVPPRLPPCPVLCVEIVDAENRDISLPNGEIFLQYTNHLPATPMITDNGPLDYDLTVGLICIDTSAFTDLDMAKADGPFKLTVTVPGYNNYIEDAIDLSKQLSAEYPDCANPKSVTAPMTD